MEKTKTQVRVNIFNQNYTLSTQGDPKEVEALAQRVDDLMLDIAKAGNLDSTRTAVLAALHFADSLRNAERELASIRAEARHRTQRLASLLDDAVRSAALTLAANHEATAPAAAIADPANAEAAVPRSAPAEVAAAESAATEKEA